MNSHILQLLSPAKLNLFLHITGRRNDGYHQIQTFFQLLDLGDQMSFSSNNEGTISLDCPKLDIPVEDNLIYQAAIALKSHSGSVKGANIQIDKQLPHGGGLGGGSSNAATTLLALNHLWDCNLNLNQLAAIGLQIGADVPLFVRGSTAWAEGIGEKLQAIEYPENSPTKHYLIIKPNCEVSTRQIFSDQQLTRNTSPITIAAFFEQGSHNDCEAVVRQLYPEVELALNWLNRFASAQLTGTGACIFAEFPDQEKATHLLEQLPNNLTGYLARGISTSPVHKVLGIVPG